MQGNAYAWFHNYLSVGGQYVIYNYMQSSPTTIKTQYMVFTNVQNIRPKIELNIEGGPFQRSQKINYWVLWLTK